MRQDSGQPLKQYSALAAMQAALRGRAISITIQSKGSERSSSGSIRL